MSDLIDRQAAVELAMNYCPDDDGPVQCDGDIRGLLDELENLPSAQPERKNGKWNTYYHSDIDFSHSCNQCGYSAPYQMIGGEVFQKKWNFCPNCGADMRGEKDD